MSHRSLVRTLDIEPLVAAAALAQRPGTLLLHGQRDWSGFDQSALLFDPRWVLQEDSQASTHWTGDTPSGFLPNGPSDELVGRLSCSWRSSPDPSACFTGLAGYLGYDLGPARWGVHARKAAPFNTPAAWIGAYDLALVFGPGEPPRLVVSDLDPLVGRSIPLPQRADEAVELLTDALSQAPLTTLGAPASGASGGPLLERLVFPDLDGHVDAVRRVQKELRDGEVYQVNLTDFATARCALDPWQAFEHQSRLNPVSFAAYLNTGDHVVSSHSPELLLHLEGERAVTAPIKGTRATQQDDVETLRASIKDRAEHIMIVDLCRNDLGVSAEYGSVEVTGLMEDLRLHRLVHMVSRIQARIPAGKRSRLLSDLFPGGSITGAPKRRAMEIIAKVEAQGRGPYTGSIGFLGRDGRALWNIAIRTAVWSQGELAFGCGGGIVLDSVPEDEHAEAVLKARSFFDTLTLLAQAQQPAQAATGA